MFWYFSFASLERYGDVTSDSGLATSGIWEKPGLTDMRSLLDAIKSKLSANWCLKVLFTFVPMYRSVRQGLYIAIRDVTRPQCNSNHVSIRGH